MAEWSIGKLISIILVLIVIVIVVLGVTGFFKNIFSSNFFKNKEQQKEQEKQSLKNFEFLLENIKKCSEVRDNKCFCEGFPKYPITLPETYELRIKNYEKEKKSEISLYSLLLKKNLNKGETSEIRVADFSLTPRKLDYNWLKNSEFYIQFNKKYPKIVLPNVKKGFFIFKKNLNTNIISGNLFKDKDIFFLTSKPMQDVNEEYFKKISEILKNSPKCIDGRIEAIKEIKKIANLDFEGTYELKLPEGFEIKYSKNTLELFYFGSRVFEIKETLNFVPVSPLPFFKKNIVCEDSEKKQGFLRNGDKIIKEENCFKIL